MSVGWSMMDRRRVCALACKSRSAYGFFDCGLGQRPPLPFAQVLSGCAPQLQELNLSHCSLLGPEALVIVSCRGKYRVGANFGPDNDDDDEEEEEEEEEMEEEEVGEAEEVGGGEEEGAAGVAAPAASAAEAAAVEEEVGEGAAAAPAAEAAVAAQEQPQQEQQQQQGVAEDDGNAGRGIELHREGDSKVFTAQTLRFPLAGVALPQARPACSAACTSSPIPNKGNCGRPSPIQ